MRRPHLFASLIVATILAAGFAPVWVLAIALVFQAVTPDADSSRQLVFRNDGSPLLQWHKAGGKSRTFEDLNGRPAEVPEDESFLQLGYIQGAATQTGESEPLPWHDRIRTFSDTRSQPTYWYFISDGQPHGSGYFVGYDVASNQRVGFLGTGGFRAERLSADEHFPFQNGPQATSARLASLQGSMLTRLPQSWWSMVDSNAHFANSAVYLLGDNHQLYDIDLKHRTVRVGLSADNLQGAAIFMRDNDKSAWLIVNTGHEVLVVDEKMHVARRYQLPPELQKRDFQWAEIKPGEAIAQYYQASTTTSEGNVMHALWLDSTGRVSRRESLASAPGEVAPNLAMAVGTPIPLACAVAVGYLAPADLVSQGAAASWPQAVRMSLANYWPGLVAVGLISALLAGFCYRRQVRYAATTAERIAWPLFVFLGGLPGWVAYRYGRRWPVLSRCPNCEAIVPRDREPCAHCRRTFPGPSLVGTEILAYPATNVVSAGAN